MSAQNRYGYVTPMGVAGGIFDIAESEINTFLNEEKDGVLKFGVGVVEGTKPGVNLALPKAGATADTFLGVVTNNRSTEYDLEGKIRVLKGAGVGVMRWGRIYVRVAKDVTPAYGDKLHMITTGEEAGYFTNADTGMAVKGRFVSGVDAANGVAVVELFNQAQE